jgi:hypothetical protein
MFIPNVQGLSSAGFSRWILVLARTNPRKLKLALLKPHIKIFRRDFIQKCALGILIPGTFAAVSAASLQQTTPKAAHTKKAPLPK